MTASLERAADLQFRDYDAAFVVQAVNELQPLGKDAALERVEAVLSARAPGRPAYGLFWVLRVLFEVPGDVGFPPVRIGTPTIQPPERAGALPRFPIVLAADVPILVVRGYTLAGFAEPVEAHVAYYREHGTIRSSLLSPAPDAARDEFGTQWSDAYGEQPSQEALERADEQIAQLR